MGVVLPAIALGVGLVLSSIGEIPAARVPGRMGFVLAGLTTLAALILLLRDRTRLREVVLKHRALVVASSALFVARGLSIVVATSRRDALIGIAQTAVVLAFLALVVAARPRRALATAAAILIVLHATLFLMGALLPALRTFAFEQAAHEHLQDLPRFRGMSGSPFASGALLLACVGLIQPGARRRTRYALIAVATLLIVATLSFASLVLPLLVAMSLRRSRIRTALATIGVVGALAMLWVHPVSMQVGALSVPLTPVHANYYQGGLGPRLMPLRALRAGPVSVTAHGTGYFYLARGGVQCALAHPLVGVGGRNFAAACDVTTMSTLGAFSSERAAHNEYVGLLAQHGLLGLVATAVFAWILRSRYRLVGSTTTHAAMWSYLFAAMAGEVLFQFGFAALLGTCLERAGSAMDPG